MMRQTIQINFEMNLENWYLIREQLLFIPNSILNSDATMASVLMKIPNILAAMVLMMSTEMIILESSVWGLLCKKLKSTELNALEPGKHNFQTTPLRLGAQKLCTHDLLDQMKEQHVISIPPEITKGWLIVQQLINSSDAVVPFQLCLPLLSMV